MRTNVLASITLAFCFLLSNQLHAKNITYDFSGSSSGLATGNLGVSSATVMSDGLSAEISGLDESGSAGTLARNDLHGLGVVGEPGTGQQTNDVGSDSTGSEALVVDFAPNSVAIVDAVFFELGMEAGELEVLADNVLLETVSWTEATGAGNTGNSDVMYTFSGSFAERTAQSFTFRALTDTFRLKSLTVSLVPEPASLGLGIIGLLGIAATTRRRRQMQ